MYTLQYDPIKLHSLIELKDTPKNVDIILHSWRTHVDLQKITDIFYLEIDYTCETFDDVVRLNGLIFV